MTNKKEVKNKKEEPKSASDINNKILTNAYNILHWQFLSATTQTKPGITKNVKGLPPDYEYYDHEKLSQIVELVKPLLKDAQTTKKVEAENSQSIINLISSGKIPVNEGIKLMALLKSKLELEEKEKKAELQAEMLNIIKEKNLNADEES
jgi:hypothetical protein